MLLGWDWVGFCIGLFGALIMEFSRFIRQSKVPLQTFVIAGKRISKGKINIWACLTSIVYIIIGGAFAGLYATTKNEALLYGLFWQVLFTFVIKIRIKK